MYATQDEKTKSTRFMYYYILCAENYYITRVKLEAHQHREKLDRMLDYPFQPKDAQKLCKRLNSGI
jgi:hypothetical protein